MGTRSFIAIKTNTDYKGVYCHLDGYLEHNGRILHEHYDSEFDAALLIYGGEISSLGKTIGEATDFDNPVSDQCVFYARDRGEKDTGFTARKNLDELLRYAENCGAEFFYLMENNQWTYAERGAQYFDMSDGSRFGEFQSLEDALAQGGK